MSEDTWTDHTIDVYFFNMWGTVIQDITVKFSASKSSVEPNTYTKDSLQPGEKWGPLPRDYQTGAFSENYDYWYVEFTSTSDPAGKFWNKNNFSCVIDSDIPDNSELHFWVSGEDTDCYTGFPNSSGGYPGEGGYSGTPKDGPGSDYTCFCSLDSP